MALAVLPSGGSWNMLEALKKAAERQQAGWLEEVRNETEVKAAQAENPSQKSTHEKERTTNQKEQAQSRTKFQMANEDALRRLQEDAVKKRMEDLSKMLGLEPEETHIEVRRTARGWCFGLIRFIVRLDWGVREVVATELRFIPKQSERIDRAYFGKTANAAADVLSCIDSLKPSEVVAWTNGKLAFLDVALPNIGASVRTGTKPFQEGGQ